MHFRKTVLLCCVTLCFNIVAPADKEDRGEEILDDQDMGADNETSAAEVGPPDSHEAMNNRDINPKIREKRSYEFLMGLINNNSRYEVTKVDTSVVTEKPKDETENMAASELLLELMVKIAAHPDQWDEVHKLLQNIDRDLTTSRNIVNNLSSNPGPLEESQNYEEEFRVHKKEILDDVDDSASFSDPIKELSNARINRTKSIDQIYEKPTKWPSEDNGKANVKFVNNNTTEIYEDKAIEIQKDTWQVQNRSTKSTYPKNFSYHRVTGKPIYLNKNPKAYIAVSVIAPKQISIRSKEDDVTLENELHQLRPWTHTQNLKNMETIRSRWVIETDKNDTKSAVPSL